VRARSGLAVQGHSRWRRPDALACACCSLFWRRRPCRIAPLLPTTRAPLCVHRYASLYFLACVDEDDNELIVLETIHHFVEVRRAAVPPSLLATAPATLRAPGPAWPLLSALRRGRCSQRYGCLLLAGARPVFRQRVRARPHLQLPQGSLHTATRRLPPQRPSRRPPRAPTLHLPTLLQAYHILDELLIAGELQEPSKKAILRVTAAQDALMEGTGDSKVSDSKYEI